MGGKEIGGKVDAHWNLREYGSDEGHRWFSVVSPHVLLSKSLSMVTYQ